MNKLVFNYKNKTYPSYIRDGDACSFCMPFAIQFCKGKGLDIGGFDDWVFPGATAINLTLEDEYDALNLPDKKYDYIFSSHTLEHIDDYVAALEYWKQHLEPSGVMFLYLPHPDMEYWLPENNKKHRHTFHPEDLKKTISALGFTDVLISERDLYWSFSVVAFA